MLKRWQVLPGRGAFDSGRAATKNACLRSLRILRSWLIVVGTLIALEHPTVVLWHGIEGSSDAVYMLATAQKAFRAGFNVVRMNFRNCGGTEHLTPTLYHGGLSEDLRAVVKELIERDGLSRLFLIGFSLGGNMVLKLAGEYGEHPPKEIIAVCAISPSSISMPVAI